MDVLGIKVASILEEGATLHLKHPLGGWLMYSGEGADPKTGVLVDKEKPHVPIALKVRGFESPSVIAAVQSVSKRRAGGEEISDDQAGNEYLSAVVIGWTGIGVNGQDESPCTPENVKAFFATEFGEAVAKQVFPFARNGKNYARN